MMNPAVGIYENKMTIKGDVTKSLELNTLRPNSAGFTYNCDKFNKGINDYNTKALGQTSEHLGPGSYNCHNSFIKPTFN